MRVAAGRGAWQPQEGLAAETTMDCNPDIAERGKMATDEEKLVSGAGERLAMFFQRTVPPARTDTWWVAGHFFVIVTLRTSL